MKSLILCSALAIACAAAIATADECGDRCCHCGACGCCRKVCRAVPSTKKVTKITYTCECEDFCVPGKSDHCVTCDECGHKKHVYTPTCAHVRTRKKLVKHETTTQEPTCKWVVETVCDACAARCAAADAANPAAAVAQRQPETVQQVGFSTTAAAPDRLPATASDASRTAAIPSSLRRVLDPIFGQK